MPGLLSRLQCVGENGLLNRLPWNRSHWVLVIPVFTKGSISSSVHVSWEAQDGLASERPWTGTSNVETPFSFPPPLDDLGPWAAFVFLDILTVRLLHPGCEQRTYLLRESIVPRVNSGPREAICLGIWPQDLDGKPSFDQ